MRARVTAIAAAALATAFGLPAQAALIDLFDWGFNLNTVQWAITMDSSKGMVG